MFIEIWQFIVSEIVENNFAAGCKILSKNVQYSTYPLMPGELSSPRWI